MSKTKAGAATPKPGILEAEDYLDLPYRIELVRDKDRDGRTGWVASVAELRGCVSQGGTPEEAIQHVRDAMLGWISIALEDGMEIPEPGSFPESPHSGRVLVRMPKSMHGGLIRLAEQEGVSLNQLVTAVLAGAIGGQATRAPGLMTALEESVAAVRDAPRTSGSRRKS